MIDKTQRHTDGGGWEKSAGYSRGVRRGTRICISGTTANTTDGPPGDTATQTRQAIRSGLDAVDALGGTIADVVRTRVYLTPGADWEQAAAVHGEVFGVVAPANTTLVVHSLIGDGFLVEVEIEAEVTE